MFQKEPEPSRWRSLTVTSLSLKEPVWSWGATTHLLFRPISSGTCSTPIKDSSFSWSTHLETALSQVSKVLRLNLGGVRRPSTWGKHQPIGKTRPSTSVLWVTQWLRLQWELNTNRLRLTSLKDSGSQPMLFSGCWHVLWRQTVQRIQNPESVWFPWHLRFLFSFFFLLQRKDYWLLNFSALSGLEAGGWFLVSVTWAGCAYTVLFSSE